MRKILNEKMNDLVRFHVYLETCINDNFEKNLANAKSF